jgi:hypothetical protein
MWFLPIVFGTQSLVTLSSLSLSPSSHSFPLLFSVMYVTPPVLNIATLSDPTTARHPPPSFSYPLRLPPAWEYVMLDTLLLACFTLSFLVVLERSE